MGAIKKVEDLFVCSLFTLGMHFELQINGIRIFQNFVKLLSSFLVVQFVYRVNHSRPSLQSSAVLRARNAVRIPDTAVRFPLAATRGGCFCTRHFPAGEMPENRNREYARDEHITPHVKGTRAPTHGKRTVNQQVPQETVEYTTTWGRTAHVYYLRVPVVPCSFREQLGNNYESNGRVRISRIERNVDGKFVTTWTSHRTECPSDFRRFSVMHDNSYRAYKIHPKKNSAQSDTIDRIK